MSHVVKPSDPDTVAQFYAEKWGEKRTYWGDNYPAWAAPYSRMYHVRNSEVAARVPHGVGRVLDCGCGVGDNLRDLAGRADELIGVDLAPANVTAAQENLEASGVAVRVEVAPVEDLPFDDASIDCVLLLDVIEHVTDRPAAAREIARVLAPGGIVIVATPVKSVIDGWTRVDRILGAPVHFAVNVAKRLRGSYVATSEVTDALYESFLTEPELAGYMTGAGLEVREHTRICFYPGPEGGGAFLHVVRGLGALPGGERIRDGVTKLLERVERRRRLNQKQLIVAAKPRA